MKDTINAVVNNLSDRLGELSTAVEPVAGKASEIARTVVEETANNGFAYTMFGVFLWLLSVVCVAVIVRVAKCIDDKKIQETVHVLAVVCSVVFAVAGFIIVLSNMSPWMSPTKHVLYEAIRQIN